MNRYPLTLRDWWRFRVVGNRYASLRIQREAIRNALRAVLLIAGLLLVYGFVGARDYEDALIAEAQAQAARADRMTAEVGLYMEGRAVWKSADGKSATVCRPAEVIPL